MVKVAQKRESSQIQIEDVRCDTVQAKSVEIHFTYICPRECVCESMSNVYRTRTHAAVSAVAVAEQQPEGWRFVPDTILPGYQWAPQWVPARTPTEHWGRSAGRLWVARTQFSTAVQCRNTANTKTRTASAEHDRRARTARAVSGRHTGDWQARPVRRRSDEVMRIGRSN